MSKPTRPDRSHCAQCGSVFPVRDDGSPIYRATLTIDGDRIPRTVRICIGCHAERRQPPTGQLTLLAA